MSIYHNSDSFSDIEKSFYALMRQHIITLIAFFLTSRFLRFHRLRTYKR